MSMAHGIEGRAPFLDLNIVHLALTIPSEMKIRRGPGSKITDKRILRSVFEGLLPSEIARREPSPFHRGSGVTDIVDDALESIEAGNEDDDEADA